MALKKASYRWCRAWRNNSFHLYYVKTVVNILLIVGMSLWLRHWNFLEKYFQSSKLLKTFLDSDYRCVSFHCYSYRNNHDVIINWIYSHNLTSTNLKKQALKKLILDAQTTKAFTLNDEIFWTFRKISQCGLIIGNYVG